MATRGIKRKEGENLSSSNIERVITLLGQDNPITKKAACEMLCIAYNTARLNRIIEAHKEKLETDSRLRKEMRNKPVSDGDAKYIVEEYLSNSPLSLISENTYRSISVIKKTLTKYNIPLRDGKHDYFNPIMLEDDTQAHMYEKNDLTYSARYCCPALVVNFVTNDEVHGNIFKLWIFGVHKQFAYQPWYELADLRKVQKELGIKIYEISNDEVEQQIYDALKKQKREDKR